MKKANVATLRSQLSSLLEQVRKGREIQIEKRNVPIAKIVPIEREEHQRENRTQLGSGKGSVKFLGDVIGPIMDEDWDMHQ